MLTWILVVSIGKMHINSSEAADVSLPVLWFWHLPGVLQADILGVVMISPSSCGTDSRGSKVKDESYSEGENQV